MDEAQRHWDQIYQQRDLQQLSWYEPSPETSLSLIEEANLLRDAALLDVGGGSSSLAGDLLRAGYTDVTVADISSVALERSQAQLGDTARRVHWLAADVRCHVFERSYDVWHDRAVLHFMVQPADRDGYLAVLRRTLRRGGHLIFAGFGPQGPSSCSGLPVDRYSAAQLEQLLGPDFESITACLRDHQTPSGRHQQFLYAHLHRRT